MRRYPAILCVLLIGLATILGVPKQDKADAKPAARAAATSQPRGVSYQYQYIATPFDRGSAYGVADDDTVVGDYLAGTNGIASHVKPFVWFRGGANTIDLPLEDGFTDGFARAISADSKHIVGSEQLPGTTGACYAVQWTDTGHGYSITRMITGHNYSENNDCSVWGVSVDNAGTAYIVKDGQSNAGYVWQGGAQQAQSPLNAPGETKSDDGTLIANANGQPTTTTPTGLTFDLQKLQTGKAYANAISRAHDETVGYSEVTNGTLTLDHAVRWDTDNSPTDLNDVTQYASVTTTNDWSNPEGVTLSEAVGVNNRGDIVGTAYNSLRAHSQEAPMLLIALPPVVFVPGVAGSHLVDANGNEKWLNLLGTHYDLGLDKSPNLIADRVLQWEYCSDWHGPCNTKKGGDLQGYGPLLDFMTQNGYVTYNDAGQPGKRTTAGCDTSQKPSNPNFFVFPYDWRKANEDTAKLLADFVGCVGRFYSGPIELVAHSMGGLVSRRYILDTGARSNVRDLATIGTPWLGAPKLVNAFETGDFASPVITYDVTKQVLPSMIGPRELLPSAAYYPMAALGQDGKPLTPFRENDWDINNDKKTDENYDYALLNTFLEDQSKSTAGVNRQAAAFHAYAGQDDWRDDTSGVQYTVMYGEQAVDSTIGQVTATQPVVCKKYDRTLPPICYPDQQFVTTLVPGDGTVPSGSSSRCRNGVNLNNSDHERVIPIHGPDELLAHTPLTKNPEVEQEILFLDGHLALDPLAGRSDCGGASPNAKGVTPNAHTASARTASPNGVRAADSPAQSGWYVDIAGTADLPVVTGPDGTTDAPTGGLRGDLADVTHLGEGTGRELTVLPAGNGTYTERFTVGDVPVTLDVRRGSQGSPDQRTGWRDLPLAAGTVVTLTLDATGVPSLTTTPPGGAATTVNPTTSVDGFWAQLSVQYQPTISASAMTLAGTKQVAITATDAFGQPLMATEWSLDGSHFVDYTGPVVVPTGTKTIDVFGDDSFGNRTPMQHLTIAALPVRPFTTTNLSPALNSNGYSDVPVTATLEPHTGDGLTATLHYTIYPPDRNVADHTATTTVHLPVSQNGQTRIHYWTEDSSGAQEPARDLLIGVDSSVPTVQVTVPARGDGFPTTLSGTAADPASGISKVEVSIQRNADGKYWNGTAWQDGVTSLLASGTTAWSLTASLPAGQDVSPGAYTVSATATSLSGVTGTGQAATQVTPFAAIRELALPAASWSGPIPIHTTGINDKGQAIGTIAYRFFQNGTSFAAKWDTTGPATVLAAGPSYGFFMDFDARGINNNGDVVGKQQGAGTIWFANGGSRTLAGGGLALAVNDAQLIGGVNYMDLGKWTGPGTSFTTLAGPSDVYSAINPISAPPPMGMNQAGDIVSSRIINLYRTDPHEDAVLMKADGTAEWLFPPDQPGDSQAYDINDSGWVVGHVGSGNFQGHLFDGPFIRSPDGTVTGLDLSPLGLGIGPATGINNAGIVVGTSTDGNGRSQPWIDANGVLTNLNSLLPPNSGWVLTAANGINNNNQVVGDGTYNGQPRGFVLSLPGPEILDAPPVVADTSVATPVDTPVSVALTASTRSTAPLTWSVVGGPSHGTASLDGPMLKYTPASGYTGPDAVQVQVSDGLVSSNVATVSVAVGSVTSATPPVAILWAPSTAVVGATVPLDGSASYDPAGSALSYSWTVDGSPAALSGATPRLLISKSGQRTIGLTVSSSHGSASASTVVNAVDVSPAAVGPGSLSMPDVHAVEGSGASLTVASFTDTDPSPGLTATLDFGDGRGAVSVPAKAGSSGAYSVVVSSPYTRAGTYPLSLVVHDGSGHSLSGTSHAIIADAPLSLVALAPRVAGLSAQDVPVATLTDGNASAVASDLSAVIAWGDGASSAGTLTHKNGGTFTVSGSHVYSGAGTKTLRVTVTDVGGKTAAVDVPLVLTAGSPSSSGGSPTSTPPSSSSAPPSSGGSSSSGAPSSAPPASSAGSSNSGGSAPTPSEAGPTPQAGSSDDLATTGSDIRLALLFGLSMVVIGFAGQLGARRRRRH